MNSKDAALVSDDEYDNAELQTPTYQREGDSVNSSDSDEEPTEQPMRTPLLTFDLDRNQDQGPQPVQIEDNEEDTQPINKAAEFLTVLLPRSERWRRRVRNIETARVAPEFHVYIDSKFHTVKKSTRQERPKIKWMQAAYFVKGKESSEKESEPKGQREAAKADTPLVPPKQDKFNIPVHEDQPIRVPE